MRPGVRVLVTTCLAIFCLASIAAETGPTPPPVLRPPLDAARRAAIDAFVEAEMQRERIPGLALGIFSHGTSLLAKGYGFANVEHGVPVKPETVFQSGSVGKQFTAAAILLLVEEGRLSLDDPITRYFPEAPASWNGIAIRHLLSHTSGLAEYEAPERTTPAGPFYLRLDFTEDELVAKVASLPIENAPAALWKYSNTNYLLLGVLIHRVTGMPYDAFLAKRVFGPLGMTSTRVISDTDIVTNRAAGYELVAAQLKNQEWVSPTFNATADGTLYVNLPDVARWDAALDGTTLLRQSSLDRWWTVFPLADGTPNPSGYGFAWFIGRQNGRARVEHSGAWQGFSAMVSRYPDDGFTVVVLANLDAAHARAGYLAHVVAGLVEPPLLPPRLQAIDDADPATAAALEHFLDHVIRDEGIAPPATPAFVARTTADDRRDTKAELAGVWPGATLTLMGRRSIPGDAGPMTSSLFRLSNGTRSALVTFRRDAEGRVDALSVAPDRDYQ